MTDSFAIENERRLNSTLIAENEILREAIQDAIECLRAGSDVRFRLGDALESAAYLRVNGVKKKKISTEATASRKGTT